MLFLRLEKKRARQAENQRNHNVFFGEKTHYDFFDWLCLFLFQYLVATLNELEKQSHNFLYLTCCEIESFSKKISGKQSLKISHSFLIYQDNFFYSFFLHYQILENMKNCIYTRFSIETMLIDFERFLDSVKLVGSR